MQFLWRASGLIALLLCGAMLSQLYPRLRAWRDQNTLPPAIILQGDAKCDPGWEECTVHNDTLIISLSLQGPLQALTAFPLQVRLAGPDADRVTGVAVSFSMSDMDMGINRFKLKLRPQVQGIWQGQALLPVCSSGRRDWQVRVEVAGDTSYRGEFVTVIDDAKPK